MFTRLDHVSIGVHDMDRARRLFCEVLGGEPLPDAGEAGDFDWMSFMLGGEKMELVTPRTPGEGGVGKYLAKYGEGFHHICCTVEDISQPASTSSPGASGSSGETPGTSTCIPRTPSAP